MAYMNQNKKATLSPAIKSVCNKYGIKASIAVRNHSTLVINIKSGAIDFIDNYAKTLADRTNYAGAVENVKNSKSIDVNPYWFKEHFTGTAKNFLAELFAAANNGNHDRSDIQVDYFDVGWYVDVNIGRWDKPYEVAK